ncbi:MAG: aminoglycoside phosphotransferase family protein [Lachnospiraceae bacterium]|nr:aminoglycoside phosphotransferase family protein [Lachnospiraceae bacterium]
MQSAVKQHISDAKIAIIVKKAFSCLPKTITEIDSSYSNNVYKIELETGRLVMLKVAPIEGFRVMNHEKNAMYTEISVLQKLKNYTKISVPEMFYYDAARTVLDSGYFFMEYFDGDTLSEVRSKLTRDEQAVIDEELGRYNKIVNEIKGSKFGYYSQKKRQHSSWYDAFHDMLEDILEDAKYYKVDLQMDPDVFLGLLENDRAVFDEVREPRLVDTDLWDGNVFVKDGGVQGIIDWERTIWGDPLMEYGFRTHHHNEAFYRGYGVRPFSSSEMQRIRWYDLYLCLTQLTEYFARDYDDDNFYKVMWKMYQDAIAHLHN